jgi:aryl-phospho-beta-D-glucosidase BglC (GH1 family)
MKKTLIVIFILSCFISFQAASQNNFLSTSGKAIVNQSGDTIILRGMGLGGWMLQEGYMLQTAGFANAQYQIRDSIEQLIGAANTDLFYDKWLENHCTKEDVDSLKSWGFNSVRLPMHYNLYTLPIEDEPVAGKNTWLTKGFEMTDSVISWCKQNQMYVILDLHAAPGGQGGDQAISDYDPTKPSLWENQTNRDKTAALWKKLAERYVNEEWVAGYDLLNEPNWDLPGGTLLRQAYEQMTDSIRSVDTQHILFIEGNWWANDFTGLTPPWDSKIVYSPHKYWSINDQGSIQWVLDIRNNHNVPLYLGESGENSNVWFRDAIRLLEDNEIGWAWWPMKKIESIAGPLSITKSPEYTALLSYWSNGGTKPTVAFAKAALIQLTEDLKIQNCTYQKGVIDAMFRQVYSNETIPFKTAQPIPGVVYASDYNLGVIGEAYDDSDAGNYSVSTGNYTAWNNGWQYRNDGVDIEKCSDNVFNNGYNVGFMNADEWMLYDINIAADAVYDINIRIAAGAGGGSFRLEMDDADITSQYYSPITGGWQTWQTLTIPNVVLKTTDKQLKFVMETSGFNLSSLEFVQKGAINSITTDFVAAETVDNQTVKMNINKYFDATTFTSTPSNFELFANGASVPITNITVDTLNPRIIYFKVNYTLKSNETIKISYNGSQVKSEDGLTLQTFTLEDVLNTLPDFHVIPGKIEAEDYFFQSGVQLETATDVGGGQNIGYLDVDDYLDYYVLVAVNGLYQVEYRTASQQDGALDLQILDSLDNVVSTVHSPNFPATGDWQSWATNTFSIQLPEGFYKIRLKITQAPFNMNWMDFSLLSNTKTIENDNPIKVFPNPSQGWLRLEGELEHNQNVQLSIFNTLGQQVMSRMVENTSFLQEQIDVAHLPNGHYMIITTLGNGQQFLKKLVIMK